MKRLDKILAAGKIQLAKEREQLVRDDYDDYHRVRQLRTDERTSTQKQGGRSQWPQLIAILLLVGGVIVAVVVLFATGTLNFEDGGGGRTVNGTLKYGELCAGSSSWWRTGRRG